MTTSPARAYDLAQLNIALPREPLDTPLLADFVAMLDPVNASADAAPGFVWRLVAEGGADATDVRGFDDDRLIVNMSTWASLEALREWVYRDAGHLSVMRRRREWFSKIDVFQCLWWVPAGHRPSVAEAEERLALLRTAGPTPESFTFRVSFPPPDAPGAGSASTDPRELCPA